VLVVRGRERAFVPRHASERTTSVALLVVFFLVTLGLGPASASPDPAQVGSWSDPMPLGVVGVHAALLSTGKVIYYELPGSTLGHARVFDPLTGVSTEADPNLDWSVFCSGIATLPDGRLFSTGGEPPRTSANPVGTGVENDAFFDPATQTWSGGPPMAYPRWYPANVDMPDGTVLVMGGESRPVEGDNDNLVGPIESFDPGTSEWTTLPSSADLKGLYPRGILLPNGHVLVPGQQAMTKELDPATDQWSSVAPMIYGARNAGGVVLLPGLQRVLTSGGITGGKSVTSSSEILDLSATSPHWVSTGSMATARMHHNMVLLPDGTVLAVGGGQDGHFGSPVETSELYDPSTGTWRTMAAQLAPRSYHSTALLLPDGRVISAGSNSGSSYEATEEIYSPPYLFKGPRPTITSAPDTIGYAGGFDVQTPDADEISRVALMRLGATTHGWDTNQRYVDLDFTSDGGVLHISGPSDTAEAPPGYYMLFILDANGIPSVAPIMALSTLAVGHDLTVVTDGNGAVTSDVGGTSCQASNLAHNSHVILTASPGAGFALAGWSGGGCTGTGSTCDVTMDSDHTVTATFASAVQLTVTMAGAGAGRVRAPPNNALDCPSTCTAGFAQNGPATLHADADVNSIFIGWSGDTAGGCTGTGDCTLTMDVARNVTATFEPAHMLHVVRTGAGTVTSDVGGINCGVSCDALVQDGAVVTLTAAHGPNSTFGAWGGDTDGGCSGTGNCVVTMDQARTITANFDPVSVPTLRDNDAAVAYNGWFGVADVAANGGFYRMSHVKGDNATWKSPVTTSLTLVTRTGPDQGKASVTIDGVNKGTVDLYSAAPAASNRIYPGLAHKTHTVVLKVLHTKNMASAGFDVRLDAFVVGATTTQESDSKIAYDTWKSLAQAMATDGTYRSATSNKATVTVTFTGTSIDWKTTKGKGYGKASVTIDGVAKGTFDMFRSATAWQSVISFGGLSSGSHTMVIQVLGQKNASATATKVVVDGFIVHA
jgi:Domain of unknown function (DUF1929)/Divergent InlB B-repeat domain/Galactose oxidase, central domain